MISRSSSSTSSRIRKSKSSSWIQQSQCVPLHSKGIDPETAHRQAINAASSAFERASQRAMATQSTKEKDVKQAFNTPSGVESGHFLQRKQSVRFTGPTAVPLLNRSITRRIVPNNNISRSSSNGRQSTLQRSTDSVSQPSESYIGSSPHAEEVLAEAYVSSLPTSYRRLRKAKSMFTSRGSQTPPQSRLSHTHLRRSFSFIHGDSGDLASSDKSHASRDAAIQLARRQYLSQLEYQRMKEKPSLIGLRKGSKMPKAFRKTVRTRSSSSYGPSAGSYDATSVENSVKNGFGYKARSLSLSLKNKLKRVFHRNSDAEHNLPIQQLDASRLHFGDCVPTPLAADPNSQSMPLTDHEILCKASSHDSPSRNTAKSLSKVASTRSIRSIRSFQSHNEVNNGKSRVTSWTDSTAANTLTSRQLPEKKRLSIIQEHGGSHQALDITRSYTDLGHIFRKPLTFGTVDHQFELPVDSQRVYSALQKRIIDNQRLNPPQENRIAPESGNKGGGSPMYENQQLELGAYVATDSFDSSSQYENCFLKARTYDLLDKNNQREQIEMCDELTPQQIAQHNESNSLPPKRPLREVKSAFFPSSMHIERRSTSPYRRVMNNSSDVGPFMAEIDGNAQLGTDSALNDQCGPDGLRSGSIIGSASVYSRTSSGNTPKKNKSSVSLTKSDSSEESGSAEMASRSKKCEGSYEPPAPLSASLDNTSTDWREWIMSEETPLNHGIENIKISDASLMTGNGHKRENAQIDGEDTQIGGLRASNPKPKQPVGMIQAMAVPRPLTKHRIFRPLTNRQPLADIEKYTTPKNAEHDVHPPQPNQATSLHWSPCVAEEKASFDTKQNCSNVLRSQTSDRSFGSQRGSPLWRQRPREIFNKSPIELHVTTASARSHKSAQAKQKDGEDSSPGEVARNRRMLSKNISAIPDDGTDSNEKLVDSYYEQGIQDNVDQASPAGALKDQISEAEVDLTDPVNGDLRAWISHKFVNASFKDRERNRSISEDNRMNIAFL